MSFHRRELARYIAQRTMKTSQYDKLVKEVAAYLLHEKHTDQLGSLIRDVLNYRAEHGYVEAVAVSSHELSTAVINDIKKLLKEEFPSAKEVHVSTKIDEQVVGGVRIEMANEQLDMTVRRKLARFRHLTEAIKE
jgi:F0F1-type ATP synthase delta subunit